MVIVTLDRSVEYGMRKVKTFVWIDGLASSMAMWTLLNMMVTACMSGERSIVKSIFEGTLMPLCSFDVRLDCDMLNSFIYSKDGSGAELDLSIYTFMIYSSLQPLTSISATRPDGDIGAGKAYTSRL
jgi:hypothetical protein